MTHKSSHVVIDMVRVLFKLEDKAEKMTDEQFDRAIAIVEHATDDIKAIMKE